MCNNGAYMAGTQKANKRCTPLVKIFSTCILLLPVASAIAQMQVQSGLERGQRVLWSNLKRALLSDKGQKYFEQNVQDALLPALRGTVISVRPADSPQIIVLALSDNTTREVTLQLIAEAPRKREDRRPAPFNGRIAAGDQVEFMGVAESFSKDPFMLTFDVAVDQLKQVPQAQLH